MNLWLWRIVLVSFAIAIVPLVVSGTASLISSVIQEASERLHLLFWHRNSDRLEGLIQLGLYLISLTLMLRVLLPRRGGRN